MSYFPIKNILLNSSESSDEEILISLDFQSPSHFPFFIFYCNIFLLLLSSSSYLFPSSPSFFLVLLLCFVSSPSTSLITGSSIKLSCLTFYSPFIFILWSSLFFFLFFQLFILLHVLFSPSSPQISFLFLGLPPESETDRVSSSRVSGRSTHVSGREARVFGRTTVMQR